MLIRANPTAKWGSAKVASTTGSGVDSIPAVSHRHQASAAGMRTSSSTELTRA